MTKPFQAPSLPQLTPYMFVKDADKSIAFYNKAFGFELNDEGAMKDESGKTIHAHMALGDAHIMFTPEGAFDMPNRTPKTSNTFPGMALYIYCEDVDAMHERAVKAGCTSMIPPMDTEWQDRMCKVADPDGHEWTFATHQPA